MTGESLSTRLAALPFQLELPELQSGFLGAAKYTSRRVSTNDVEFHGSRTDLGLGTHGRVQRDVGLYFTLSLSHSQPSSNPIILVRGVYPNLGPSVSCGKST